MTNQYEILDSTVDTANQLLLIRGAVVGANFFERAIKMGEGGGGGA